MSRLATLRVLLITDGAAPDERIAAVVAAVCGARLGPALGVQLRDKLRPDAAVLPLARRLRGLTRDAGALFFVNDRVEVAAAVEADGVHCPEQGPTVAAVRARLGPVLATRVAHDDASAARDDGADGLLVSPIFSTPGKGPARGVAALSRARAAAPATVAIVALGGIGLREVPAVARAGASAVAVVRALFAAVDPAAAARALGDALERPC